MFRLPPNRKKQEKDPKELARLIDEYRIKEGKRMLKEAYDDLDAKDLMGDVIASIRCYNNTWKTGTIYSFDVDDMTQEVNSIMLEEVVETKEDLYSDSISKMVKLYNELKEKSSLQVLEIKAEKVFGITYQNRLLRQ